MSTKSNVSTAKPKTGGALYVAPLGTALPSDATTTLNEAFVSLGYMGEDGLTNSNTKTSEDLKAWNGDVVDSYESERKDTFKGKLIEVLNPDVLKVVHGDANVSGTLTSGISVKVNGKEAEEQAFVCEMIMRGGVLKRIVIPRGKITELADVVYKRNELVGYEVTITAYALDDDSEGNTHYEYIVKPA